MGVCRVEKVQLTPSERSTWLCCGILCIWLHTTNVSCQDYISLGMLASLTGQNRSSRQQSNGGNNTLETHNDSSQAGTKYAADLNESKEEPTNSQLSDKLGNSFRRTRAPFEVTFAFLEPLSSHDVISGPRRRVVYLLSKD